MIAIDLDGTLLGDDGRVSPRNLAALLAAQAAGIEVVVATGRRHTFALNVLRPLGLHPASVLISSNGTVTRTLGSCGLGTEPIPSELISRFHLSRETALWLCGHIGEFRNALVLTFDRVAPDGTEPRGALVVEQLDELNASIGRWMAANEPYIARIVPIESAFDGPESSAPGFQSAAPIQAMLCGTVDRMARAEARLLEHPGITASSDPSGRSGAAMLGTDAPSKGSGAPSIALSPQWVGGNTLPSLDESSLDESGLDESSLDESRPDQPRPFLTLHRTEYPGRDLSILDILPAGCSKGAALLSLAAARGIVAAQIMAIGDNWNDLSMLDASGVAVLMDNAPEDLKALAYARGWRIGPSNRSDGVAEAIESALSVACE